MLCMFSLFQQASKSRRHTWSCFNIDRKWTLVETYHTAFIPEPHVKIQTYYNKNLLPKWQWHQPLMQVPGRSFWMSLKTRPCMEFPMPTGPTAGSERSFGRSSVWPASVSFIPQLYLSLTHWGRDKLRPFRRRHFQMHFLEWKCMNSA